MSGGGGSDAVVVHEIIPGGGIGVGVVGVVFVKNHGGDSATVRVVVGVMIVVR